MKKTWLVLLLIVGVLDGCQRPPLYREGWAVPPPPRAELPPISSDQCSANCVLVVRATESPHEIDQVRGLKIIAQRLDLNLHDQLHLIEATVALEMFGIDPVFMELAKNPYLRETARGYLLNYADRVTGAFRQSLVEQLIINRGVPDRLTPMEKFVIRYFELTDNQVFDHHRQGYAAGEIITIYWLAKTGRQKPKKIIQWRQKGLWWQEIIEKKLKLSLDILKIELPVSVRFPEKFRRFQDFYRGEMKKQILTDEEIIWLIQLKMLNFYYDRAVEDMISNLAQGKNFDDMVLTAERKPR